MRDPIGEVIRKVQADRQVRQTRFTNTFLNNVGIVLERYGFGAMRAYLLTQAERSDLRAQAETLLHSVLPVLEASEPVQHKRALGRTVIKALIAMQASEV